MSIWERLGISPTKDKALIRHAYSEQSKGSHVEADPEGFRELYAAYKQALRYAARTEESVSEEQTPVAPEPNNYLLNAAAQATLPEINSIFDTWDTTFMELPLLIDLRTAITERRAGKLDFWKDFVESDEFLEHQYDESFILCLVNSLSESYEDPCNMPDTAWVALGTAYDLLENFDAYDDIRFAPLQALYAKQKNCEYIGSKLKKKEIIAWRTSFDRYVLLMKAYELKLYEPTLSVWTSAVKYMDMDILPVVFAKKDPVIFRLLARVINHYRESRHEVLELLRKTFKLDQSNRQQWEQSLLIDAVNSAYLLDMEDHFDLQLQPALMELQVRYQSLCDVNIPEKALQFFQNELFLRHALEPEWLAVMIHLLENCAQVSYETWERSLMVYSKYAALLPDDGILQALRAKRFERYLRLYGARQRQNFTPRTMPI